MLTRMSNFTTLIVVANGRILASRYVIFQLTTFQLVTFSLIIQLTKLWHHTLTIHSISFANRILSRSFYPRRNFLLVTCYFLLVTCYFLLITGYFLLVTFYSVLFGTYLLLVATYWVLIAFYSYSIALYSQRSYYIMRQFRKKKIPALLDAFLRSVDII